MPKTNNADDFLTRREAADLLRLAVKTLDNWRSSGIGPRFHKLEQGRVLYSRKELAAYLRRSLRQTASAPPLTASSARRRRRPLD